MANTPLMVRTVNTRKHQDECRQQLQKRWPEVEREGRPFAGNAEPVGRGNAVEAVGAECRGGRRTGDQRNQGPPGTQFRRSLDHDAAQYGYGRQYRQWRRRGCGSGGDIVQHVENHGHDRHRDEQQHDAGDRRRENAPEQGELHRDQKLDQGRNRHQRGQEADASRGKRIDADRDCSARRPGNHDITGTDTADAQGLHRRDQAGDDDGREHRPDQCFLRGLCGAEYDQGDHDRAAQGKQCVLEAETGGQPRRGHFVGFVEDLPVFGIRGQKPNSPSGGGVSESAQGAPPTAPMPRRNPP